MARVRVSTTVDQERLEAARRLADLAPSKLFDRALDALCREIEAQREAEILAEQPYEGDPDVAWQAPMGPHLPYEGSVPEDVLRLAARRRRERESERKAEREA